MAKKNMIPKKGMNPALVRMSQYANNEMLIRSAEKANMLLTLTVLHEKFGMGTKRLERFVDEYKKLLDEYNNGNIESAKDFEEVILTKCGIKIEF